MMMTSYDTYDLKNKLATFIRKGLTERASSTVHLLMSPARAFCIEAEMLNEGEFRRQT